MSVKSVVPFKVHKTIDYLTLVNLALVTAIKDIRRSPKALAYHLGFLALATTNVLLTNWDRENS